MARTANIFVSVVYFEREKKTKREKKGQSAGPGPGAAAENLNGRGRGRGGATVVSKNLNQTDWRTDRKAFRSSLASSEGGPGPAAAHWQALGTAARERRMYAMPTA